MAIIERRVNDEPLAPVALASPHVVQGYGGALTLRGHTLTGETDCIQWLYQSPDGGTVVATRLTSSTAPWTLRLASGEQIIVLPAAGPIRLTCMPRAGTVDVEHVGPIATHAVICAGWHMPPTVRLHDESEREAAHATATEEGTHA